MTGGQEDLSLDEPQIDTSHSSTVSLSEDTITVEVPIIYATEAECQLHESFVKKL